MDDMDEAPVPGANAGLVRYLKWLVTTLTVTMIVGLIVLIALVVMRFNQTPALTLPETITLPAGAQATAITRGTDFLVVVTTDGRILIYDGQGTTIQREIAVEPSN